MVELAVSTPLYEGNDASVWAFVRLAKANEAMASALEASTATTRTDQEWLAASAAYRAAVPSSPLGVAMKVILVEIPIREDLVSSWIADAETAREQAGGMHAHLLTVIEGIKRGALDGFVTTGKDPAVVAADRLSHARSAMSFVKRRLKGTTSLALERARTEVADAQNALLDALPSSPAGYVAHLGEVAAVLYAVSRGELTVSEGTFRAPARHMLAMIDGMSAAVGGGQIAA